MENQKTSSSLPLAIIGLVLLAAIVGGWWFYSSSKTASPNSANTNRSVNNSSRDEAAKKLYANAPAGAQPANAIGAPSAAVKIEEFADYQCPTCAAMHKTMKEINSQYGGRIQFVYRSYPLVQIHKNAFEAALAAEAAGQQGKYWAMQDQLFTNQQAWSNSAEAKKIFEDYAGKIGLDVPKFQADMAGMITQTRVNADLERGKGLAISGTPTIFINGNRLDPSQMEINTMRQLIDAELQKAGGQNQTSQPAAANQSPVNNSAPSSTSANTTGSAANK